MVISELPMIDVTREMHWFRSFSVGHHLWITIIHNIQERYGYHPEHAPLQQIPCCLFGRIRFLTDRFTISTLSLSSVRTILHETNVFDQFQLLIDNHFLHHCEYAFPRHSIDTLELHRLNFAENIKLHEHRL